MIQLVDVKSFRSDTVVSPRVSYIQGTILANTLYTMLNLGVQSIQLLLKCPRLLSLLLTPGPSYPLNFSQNSVKRPFLKSITNDKRLANSSNNEPVHQKSAGSVVSDSENLDKLSHQRGAAISRLITSSLQNIALSRSTGLVISSLSNNLTLLSMAQP